MDENLHSLKKLKNDIETFQRISFMLPENRQIQIKNLQNQLEEIEKSTTLFNKYFSDLGWCFYDSMDMSLIKTAISEYESYGADAGEKVLLDYYKTDVKQIIYRIKNRVEVFAQRYDLIQKALDDHFAGRYYASVPLLLIIIDGAVNDYTKSKGFFAEGTDLTAWDCLVGCSDGLTKVQGIFNKGRKKTNHDEIRIPYRNGILHGRDLNYGNEYVSCKCVALMFALTDWMSMKDSEEIRKAKFEKDSNPPPISESLKQAKEIALKREEIRQWKKRNVIIGVDIPSRPTIEDCEKFQYIVPVVKVFDAWKSKNYGELSLYLKNLFSYEKSEKKRAGECRQMFSSKNLCSFEIKEIEEQGCSMTRILVQADWEVNGKHFSEPLEFGVLYQNENEKIALPWRGDGVWCLIPRNIQGLNKM